MFKKPEPDYTEIIKVLENNPTVITHIRYQSMSSRDYYDLINEWDVYYKKVRGDSLMYELYRDSYKAMFIDKNIKRVTDNAMIAKEWLINGDRLSFPCQEDPRVISRRSPVPTYLNLVSISKKQLLPKYSAYEI